MITAAEIRALLSADYVLAPDPRDRDGAPAERFEVRRRRSGPRRRHGPVLGTVGIIASVTEPFCSDCRRTRITAEGKIMSCLFSREEVDLLGLLRERRQRRGQLAERWQDAMWIKPKAHGMDHVGTGRPGLRPAGPQHECDRRIDDHPVFRRGPGRCRPRRGNLGAARRHYPRRAPARDRGTPQSGGESGTGAGSCRGRRRGTCPRSGTHASTASRWRLPARRHPRWSP